MTTGQKIADMRKKTGMKQEELADAVGVTRQAVSKWEVDAAFPETDKLVRLSRLFGCSVDYLLKEEASFTQESSEGGAGEGTAAPYFKGGMLHYEYKSKRTLCGLPLVHINLGWGKTAKGIVAVGFKARGILSLGLLSMGVVSVGCLSLGVLSFGAAVLGILSFGALAAGLFLALGAVAVGFLAYGAVAVGFFSAGALAVAQYVAVGDHAYAAVPIARTLASGGELFDFYFLYAAPSGAAQVGVYRDGTLVPAAEELARAVGQCVPRFLRGFAEMFAKYRLY